MRWYCVWFLVASELKNQCFFLLSANVTLTASSLKDSSAGDGKKSLITLTSAKGSLVYLIFLFINSFPNDLKLGTICATTWVAFLDRSVTFHLLTLSKYL